MLTEPPSPKRDQEPDIACFNDETKLPATIAPELYLPSTELNAIDQDSNPLIASKDLAKESLCEATDHNCPPQEPHSAENISTEPLREFEQLELRVKERARALKEELRRLKLLHKEQLPSAEDIPTEALREFEQLEMRVKESAQALEKELRRLKLLRKEHLPSSNCTFEFLDQFKARPEVKAELDRLRDSEDEKPEKKSKCHRKKPNSPARGRFSKGRSDYWFLRPSR